MSRRETTRTWVHLLAFLATTFYLCLMGFLVVWVVVPSLGFRLDPVVITSGSMAPLIQSGDVVLVAEELPDDVAVGTVITYAHPSVPDALVTHRVLRVEDDGRGFVTKGDANHDPDSTVVAREDVVGVARLLVPRIGGPSQWLSGAPLRFLVWALCTALACVVALRPPDDELATELATASDPVVRESWTSASLGVLLGPVRDLARRLVAPRPQAHVARRWATVVVLPAAAALLSPNIVAGVAATVVVVAVLIIDPSGPEVRIGRVGSMLGSTRRPTSAGATS